MRYYDIPFSFAFALAFAFAFVFDFFLIDGLMSWEMSNERWEIDSCNIDFLVIQKKGGVHCDGKITM